MASSGVSVKEFLTKKRKYDQLQSTIKDMQSLMECPVCLDLPHSRKIFCCESGHVVCEPDLIKLAKYKGSSFSIRDARSVNCPTCVMKKVSFRNLPLEKVIEKSLANWAVECRFGCGAHHGLEDMSQHEKLCAKRLVKCPDPKCKWEGPLDRLIPHGEGKCLDIIRTGSGDQPVTFSANLTQPKNSTDGWKPILFSGGIVDVVKPYLTIRKEEGKFMLKMWCFLSHDLCKDMFSRIETVDFGRRFKSGAVVTVDSAGCKNPTLCSRNEAKHERLEVSSDMFLHPANESRGRDFILQYTVTLDMQNELRPQDVGKWERETQKCQK